MTKARDLANASTALSAVSATELGYLDGVTSAVQTQIDGKQAVVSGVNSTEIGYLDGVTSAIQTQLDSKAATSSATLTASVLVSPEERMTVSATAATGTINFDADTQGVLYYTSDASADWTLNIRGSGSTTINSKLATGDSTTVAFLVTNGSTAYKHSALTIDGSAQTVKWSGGTAPAAGNASAIDAYSFTIIKTASATYTVLGAGPIKYA
jgi:hypothetical protein